MGPGTDSPVLAVLLLCVLATVVLAAIGVWLRRTRRLTTRPAALIWAIVTIAPLFGAGFVMMTKHTVQLATGEDKPGVTDPAR